MAVTWNEIILQRHSVKEHGPPYTIGLGELRAAVPQELRELSAVEALNAALAGNSLIAVVDAKGGFVSVIRRRRPLG